MIDRIKKFFDAQIKPQGDSPTADTHRLHLAVGALIMEMIRTDGQVHEQEEQAAGRILRAHFGLTNEETAELILLAAEEGREAVGYHRFTSLINKDFTAQQKIQVVEMLWQVAYADAHLEKYEEHMVRQIAELLYVPHTEFIAAKHRVLAAMGREK
jgi:uncharacterized tellurite resistance protein B-like protein